MRVRMKIYVSGTRNGADWPPPGGTLDVPAAEAASLIALGIATEADDDGEPPVEEATAPEAETSTPSRRKPSTRRR